MRPDIKYIRSRNEPFRGYAGRNFRGRPNILWASTRLLHVEAIILVVSLWMLAVILALGTTVDNLRDFIIGSVIGVAAAPWVWLHFARRLYRTEAEPQSAPISEVPESNAPARTDNLAEESTAEKDAAATDQPGDEQFAAGSRLADFDRYKLLTIVSIRERRMLW